MIKTFFRNIIILGTIVFIVTSCNSEVNSNIVNKENSSSYVNRFIGSGGNGGVTPVASMPFGMVQLGPDTRTNGSGYHYNDKTILGFSHVHKSGGGCNDFQDILFLPIDLSVKTDDLLTLKRGQLIAPMRHEDEFAKPGYYEINLYENQVKVKLTASLRCGYQKYKYKSKGNKSVLIDLEHGSDNGCSIVKEQDVDTVQISSIKIIDKFTVAGSRISSGWSPEQHVYFYTTFSHPIKSVKIYNNDTKIKDTSKVSGNNIKAIITFDDNIGDLEIKTGISPVDITGAKRNLNKEISNLSFDKVKSNSSDAWSKILNMINIKTKDTKKKELFYTALFNTMLYPMLYSDTDNRYRGPDRVIRNTNGYSNYSGVMGLWDTFRAACPLQSVLHPEIMEDYIKTSLDHYKVSGQLPIWTLAGTETYQMIGLPAMPVITNAYLNEVRGFDINYAMEAMRASAMKDTIGYSMGYFVGLENYKKLGYVPCDLEMESVARTLEYSFADKAIAEFAKQTGNKQDYVYFKNRSLSYKNIIDPESKFARGKTASGDWKTPFNPLQSEHRRDDYCEGNAWQWTFFVPHDFKGLGGVFGGKDVLLSRLDSLFTIDSNIHGKDISGDITGLIGQYAHGNEPSHHIAYIYNHLGKPRKTQQYVNEILTTLYDNTPDGICGNEDTGQMSAWYIFSSMGFYPMDPVSGKYELGAPLFDETTIKLPSGKKFVIKAMNLSEDNKYVKEVYLNNIKLNRNQITFSEVLEGGELLFVMTN
ncbi:GH92 family glycosyl hydrolase [Flavicella sediminum]|uniref:GH92 family glycosyl hydrolase n=1 Tax=Flavicella sediminum TaxID=2585141 RepID=UPI0011204B5C|nr:GH92 family glycosyl hydrolase [Flavicella sediminum]